MNVKMSNYYYKKVPDLLKFINDFIPNYFSKHDSSRYEAYYTFKSSFNYIIDILETFTVNEFINMFPIIKEYDGNKYGTVDYFSTMEMLKDNYSDFNKVLGEKCCRIIMDYNHTTVRELAVIMALLTTTNCMLDCKKTPIDMFFQNAKEMENENS